MTFWNFILKHKFWSALILIAFSGGGYYWYQKSHPAPEVLRYIVSPVKRGTVISSVQGTGQVSTQSSVDLHPSVSGRVSRIFVSKNGQPVKAGDLIVQLDTRDADQTVRDAVQGVRDAQIGVDAASLALQKLKQPATALSMLQAQDAVRQAQADLDKLNHPANTTDIAQAQADIRTAQQSLTLSADGKNTLGVRNAYDQMVPLLRSTITNLQSALLDADEVIGVDNQTANPNLKQFLSVLDSSKISIGQAQYLAAKTAFANAKTSVDPLANANQDTASIDQATSSTLSAVDTASQLLSTVMQELASTPGSTNFSQTSIDALKGTIQGDRTNVSAKLTSIVTQEQAVQSAQTAYVNAQIAAQKAQLALQKLQQPPDPRDVVSAEQKISEARASLQQLQDGALPIDIQIAQNTVSQRKSALAAAQIKLLDARQTLLNYEVRAPFDGTMSHVNLNLGDVVGQSSAVATLLTAKKVATITLNEVDAASVAVGQKASLTFDALPGLSMSGQVAEIDPLGVVTQGVVNYSLKVAFDTQDERIKAGMSVTVAVIKQADADVLTVPNSAVKILGNQKYVQVAHVDAAAVDAAAGTPMSLALPPEQRAVSVGLTNDKLTEIVSGLQVGEMIVTQTISSAAKTAASSNAGGPGGIRIPGLTGGGGGVFRGGGRGGG